METSTQSTTGKEIETKSNRFNKLKLVLEQIVKVFLVAITVPIFILLLYSVYMFGYNQGFTGGQLDAEEYYLTYIEDLGVKLATSVVKTKEETIKPTIAPKDNISQSGLLRDVSWGGPELWEAVNKRRVEFGVNPLNQADELCTIASLRLNEQIELGKLDGHEGFGNLDERREDLAWIFEKYGAVAEFLLAGADTANEAVSLWENTLAHKKLLTGGEYVWGCIYAQNSFAVAITAY